VGAGLARERRSPVGAGLARERRSPVGAGLARDKLGWTPRITFQELVAEMVREDLAIAKRDNLVRNSGYTVMSYHE
jgi:nucleoside-diphosphate-sugar epimerase